MPAEYIWEDPKDAHPQCLSPENEKILADLMLFLENWGKTNGRN